MMRQPAKIAIFICIICTYIFFGASLAVADNRTENIDLFLVVDKSLSMESKIDAVKQYIDTSIVKNMLIPGDYLTVIDFWGKAQVLLSTTVGTDKTPLEKKIDSIQANGQWTDIGNALDQLKKVIDAGNYPNHRKYFMLITDGIQEAPPTSKYYSPSGKFNHAFLKNTKTIQEKGWKIEILGIGTETAAANLAKSLSGGFASVSNNPTPQELAQKTKDLLGVIQATNVAIRPVRGGGKSTMALTLESSGYSEAKTVNIANVQIVAAGTAPKDVAQGISVTIAPNEKKNITIPILLPGVAPGTHNATITFTFSGDSSFSPAVFDTKVSVNGFVQNHLVWIIAGGVLVILLVLLAVFLISRSARSRRVVFQLTIEGDLKQSNKFVLKSGESLSIQDTPMGFRAVPKQVQNPVAMVRFDGTMLRLEILNASRLTGESIPPNVLGERVQLKTNASKNLFLQFDPA